MDKAYIFNEDTLKYDEVGYLIKFTPLSVFITLAFIIGYTSIVSIITLRVKNTNDVKDLIILRKNYQNINNKMTLVNSVIDNLIERDNTIYTTMLGIEPKKNYLWFGPNNQLNEVLSGKSNPKILTLIKKKLLKIKHNINVVAESQDLIINELNTKEFMLSSIPSILPIKNFDLKNKKISGFGYRKHPIFKVIKMHTGIDFPTNVGVPIYSTGNGKVIKIEHKINGYGKNVTVDHGYGYKTLYAHMSKMVVKLNQRIKRGEVLGFVGNTGDSTGPHLHYEVIYNGKKINPLPFCLNIKNYSEYKEFVILNSLQNQAMSIN
jgi:murein DD-endopeptidase MepM/ murein hydrolase activator NlpD